MITIPILKASHAFPVSQLIGYFFREQRWSSLNKCRMIWQKRNPAPFLFESPDPNLRVSLWLILPTVLTLAVITLVLVQRVFRSRAYPVATGKQGLIGEIGEASTDINLEGLVFVHGENWKAMSDSPIEKGEKVRVTAVTGLCLEVRAVSMNSSD